MRNPNGYGGVVKLSGSRRRPYLARVTDSIVKGKQTYKIIGYFETQEEALDALAKQRLAPVADKPNITLKELFDEWSKTKFKKIAKSTEDNYNAAWLYIKKYKSIKFRELRTSHFQSCIDDCGKGRATCEKIRNLVSQLYKYACANDIVIKNYAEFLELPPEDKSEREIFTGIEIKILWDNIKTPYVDTILMLIYTGFRIGEFLSLTRFGVDVDNQTLTGGSKTEAGKNRTIPIHPKILPYVKKWYDMGNNMLITRNGNPIRTKYYREDIYKPLLESIGIKYKTPHSTRHTFLTMLSEKNVNTVAIQKLAGHADYSTTADKYTHYSVDDLKKAINAL